MKYSDGQKTYQSLLTIVDNFLAAHNNKPEKITNISSIWIYYKYQNITLPTAGWKIHISSHPENFIYHITNLIQIINQKSVNFKICKNFQQYALLNQGLLGEAQIGKMLTLYPKNKKEALDLYEIIRPFCRDQRAPKVPSDVYFDAGDSISFRYGQFEKSTVIYDSYGQEKFLIPNEKNILVADDRSIFGDRFNQKAVLKNKTKYARSLPLTPLKPQQKKISFAGTEYQLIRSYGRSNKGVLLLQNLEKFTICKYAQKNTGISLRGFDYATNLKNEYNILRNLNNKISCPQVLNILEDDFFYYLFLSDVGGDSLDKLPTSIARRYFSHIIILLQDLHKLDFIHRDIKRENFILNIYSNKLFLIDFELAQKKHSPILYHGGTPGYCAPLSYYNNRASLEQDYYALGALLASLAANIDPNAIGLGVRELPKWVALCGYKNIAHWVEKLMAPGSSKNICLDELLRESQQANFFSSRRSCLITQEVVLDTNLQVLKNFYREENQKVYWPSFHPSLVYEHQGIHLGSSGMIIGLHSLYKSSQCILFKELLIKTARALAQEKPYLNAHGLFTGNAGAALALAVASQYNSDFKIAALERFELACTEPKEYDLFYGSAGILFAGLIISDILANNKILTLVNKLGNLLYNNIANYEGLYSWPAPQISDEPYPYVGISHGALGIAMSMGIWAKKINFIDARALAIEVYKRVYKYGRTKNNNFLRYNVHPQSPGYENNAWCHGVGGFLWGMVNLKLDSDENALLSPAFHWALKKYIASYFADNPTLCHGLAGDFELSSLLINNYEGHYKNNIINRQQRLLSALSLVQKKDDFHNSLWPCDDPSTVCMDLWVGSLGPMSVLAQAKLTSYSGILSSTWLKKI